MRKALLASAVFVAMAAASPVFALSDSPYLAPGAVDAILLLPPPPASPDIQARDLADVLRAQETRNPALVQRALNDKVDIIGFASVLGPKVTDDYLPHATAFRR
jgi:hypothetical protein